MTSAFLKETIIQTARKRYEEEYQPILEIKAGGCLLLAAAAQWAIRQHMPEVQTIITAGTTNFRFRTEENDDGVSATHFSYEFETMAAIARAANGDLPEMHAWVVVHPETRDITKMELVDLSTGDQIDQMKRIIGLEWDKELIPPDYLWCRADHIPEQFLYRSHPAARQIAMHFLEAFYVEHGLEEPCLA